MAATAAADAAIADLPADEVLLDNGETTAGENAELAVPVALGEVPVNGWGDGSAAAGDGGWLVV